MKQRITFFLCVMLLFSAQSWGQTTWNLSSSMTATLDNAGVLTISTTASSEAMPDFSWTSLPPWLLEVDPGNILSVVIGDKVTTIGQYAFNNCVNLTSVTISNSVTTIGRSAFDVCSSLTSIILPNSVTTIGYGAFNACDNLTSITLPNSVTTIGQYAFAICISLTSITIPNSVTDIGSGAFSICTGLEEVTVEWTTPLSVPDGIFDLVNLSAATLYVPTNTTALYQAANVWKDFGTVVEYSPAGIEPVEGQTLKAFSSDGLLHITGLQSGTSLRIYNLAGQPVYQGVAHAAEEYVSFTARGIYVIAAGEQTVKVIIH